MQIDLSAGCHLVGSDKNCLTLRRLDASAAPGRAWNIGWEDTNQAFGRFRSTYLRIDTSCRKGLRDFWLVHVGIRCMTYATG